MASRATLRVLLLLGVALALAAGGFYLGLRPSAPPRTPTVPPSAAASMPPEPADRAEVVEPPPDTDEAPAVEPEPAPTSGTAQAPPSGRRRTQTRLPAGAPPTPVPALAPPQRPTVSVPLRPPPLRAFVAGLTQTGSTRDSSAELKGFDPTAYAVKRAPEGEGAIEFEVVPSRLAPGQPYTVKVFLRNRGERPIRVKQLTIASEMNGRHSGSSLSPRSKDVEPAVVGLLAEVPGIWKETVDTWSLEVQVLTGAGDIYSNRVIWR